MKKLRVFLSIGFSLTFILFGCSSTQTKELTTNYVKDGDHPTLTKSTPAKEESIIDIFSRVDRISVISPEGSEIILHKGKWIDFIKDQLKDTYVSQTPILSFDYTLILWTDDATPFILQVGQEGFNLGDHFYRSDNMADVMALLGQEIGKQFLIGLNIEAINVFSLDVVNLPLEVDPDLQVQFTSMIKEAVLMERQPDTLYPLFPHYVIQIMDGGKSVVNLDVIGANVFALPLGNDKFLYYEVKTDLFESLFILTPPLDVKTDHLKSLFKASAVRITRDEQEPIQIGAQGMISLQTDSYTDSIVRLLMEGNIVEEMPDLKPFYIVEFMDDQGTREVQIFTDGFIYNQHYYSLQGIGDKILKHFEMLLQEKN